MEQGRTINAQDVYVGGGRERRQEEQTFRVDGDGLEIVDQFCYLGEMMTCESGAGEAARVRIAAAWKKWRALSLSFFHSPCSFSPPPPPRLLLPPPLPPPPPPP